MLKLRVFTGKAAYKSNVFTYSEFQYYELLTNMSENKIKSHSLKHSNPQNIFFSHIPEYMRQPVSASHFSSNTSPILDSLNPDIPAQDLKAVECRLKYF